MAIINENRMQDIPNTLYGSVYNFNTLMAQERYQEAWALLTNDLFPYIFDANRFNTIGSIIPTIEQAVIDNVNKGYDGKDAIYLQSIINGIINISEEWSYANEYKMGNVVYDNTTKNYYFAIKDVPVSILTTNADYWVNIYNGNRLGNFAPKKDTTTDEFIWESTTAYSVNDLVTDADYSAIYIALSNNTGNDPRRSPGYWNKIVSREDAVSLKVGDTLLVNPLFGTFYGLFSNYN